VYFGYGVVLAFCVGMPLAAPASAQGSYSPYDESATAALARYVRTLASDPKDFEALIGAGKAALALGDAQAAAGFFARADDVDARSPLPEAGMGAVAVANGEPKAALPYFKRAQQLGASVASFACERGLAYDLMGQQAQAQADYRLALGGSDGDEARRRLALSLAISGSQAEAIATLAPLSAKGDPGTARIRAFVLALTGDSKSALSAINAAMPGASASVAPYLQRLPALTAGQKAAAVNLGIFPDSGGTAYAYSTPVRVPGQVASASTDRLSGIDAMLRGPTAGGSAASAPSLAADTAAGADGVSVSPRARQRPAHRCGIGAEDLASAWKRRRRRRSVRALPPPEVEQSRPVRWDHALHLAQRRWCPAPGRSVPRQERRHHFRRRFGVDRRLADAMDQFTSRQDCATAG
jgi:Flp pilus assembly protein TadD